MYSHVLLRFNGPEARVVRSTHTGEEGFDIVAKTGNTLAIAETLERAGAALGGRWVGLEAQEILRVEAGLPRYGVDMSEENILLETGLDHAVSFQKGCYLGQEVIERIHSRGHVNRKLTGLTLDGGSAAARGDAVLVDGKEVGRVTSSVISPKLHRPIALAYLHRDYLKPAVDVTVRSSTGDIAATVAALPFVYETSP
jgi:folate-binding protein YgfZ